MTWRQVLSSSEIDPGRVAVVDIDGERLAICRTDDAILRGSRRL